MKNNMITWYNFKKKFDCSNYVTISTWNKLNRKQVKCKDIKKYLESFFWKNWRKIKSM